MYAEEVAAQVQTMEDEGNHPDTDKINVDIKTYIIKSMYARWLIAVIEEIPHKTDCIIGGFVQAGLK